MVSYGLRTCHFPRENRVWHRQDASLAMVAIEAPYNNAYNKIARVT